MIKKLFPLLIWLLVSASTTLSAQNVDLFLDTATVKSGSDVTLNLTAKNFTKIYVLEFVLQWDSTVLEYKSHQDFNGKMGFETAHFATPDGIGRSDVFKIAWNDPNVKGVDLPDDDVLFSITFKAIGNNGTRSPVVFTIGPPPFSEWEIVQDFREYSHQEIEDATHDGLVIVSTDGGGGPSMDLIGSHETVSSGEEACVDVKVKGFTNIKSMDAVMRYDENVIQFKKIQNLNLPQLTQGNFTNPEPGEVRLSYNYVDGATVSNNTKIFEVCFDAVGNNGTSSQFKFTDGNPNPPLEAVNTDDEALNIRTQHGSVTIGGSGGDLYFEIDDYQIDDINMCIPIRVSGFEDIVGYTQSISFDPSFLKFEQVSNFALDNIGLALNENNTAQGKLGILWSTGDGLPKSLADESVLMELCFSLVDDCEGGTTISFSDDPVTRELYEAPNIEIFPEYISGNISCMENQVKVSVKDASCEGVCDGEIALGVSGWGIENIQWSDSNLPSELRVTDLCPGSYSVTITFENNTTIVESSIEVGYGSGPDISGIDVYADTGGGNGAIEVNTSDSSLSYAWSNGASEQNVDGLSPGTYSVTISTSNGCEVVRDGLVVLGANLDITDATCHDSEDGAATITISGGSGNYSYEWSCSDQTGNSASNLPGGNCMVIVTDNDGDFDNIVRVVVGAPDPISLSNISILPDDGSGNGSIDLIVVGGTSPYNYEWSNGATTKNIDELTAGVYTVTITDSRGCTHIESVEVTTGQQIMKVSTSASEFNGYGVACSGDCNGYIEVEYFDVVNPVIVWEDGAQGFSRTDLCPGEYTFTFSSADNPDIQRTVVIEEPSEIVIQGVETDCASGKNGMASVEVTGGTGSYSFFWDNDNTPSEGTVNNLTAGNHEVFVADSNGCEVSQTFTIQSCDSGESDCFKGRKVITPNGDGKNDELYIKYCGQIQSAEINIYTQWGELIYQDSNYQNDWEGTSKGGDILDDGLYHWVLKVVLGTGEIQIHKGSVNLVRTMN